LPPAILFVLAGDLLPILSLSVGLCGIFTILLLSHTSFLLGMAFDTGLYARERDMGNESGVHPRSSG
jgi:hypothetical protein